MVSTDNDTSVKLKEWSADLNAMIKRRGFYWPSYEIYGGVRGFYDYGPLGSLLKNNVENLWRRFYVIGEGFAEISTPTITPEEVFIASGHVEEFTDIVIQCDNCGETYRADHYLSQFIPHAETMSLEDVVKYIHEMDVRCMMCDKPLKHAYEFNLMFATKIGIGRERKAYMRPETAQAMFINFPALFRYFRGQLPFGVVQIGKGYRNEISPRQGILRQREFNMAELELFIDPEMEKYPRFKTTENEVVTLIPRDSNGAIAISLKDACKHGIIQNEALAHYIGITKRFLVKCGIKEDMLRFRQHRRGEMAHYARDCWDAEVLTSYGWIEVVGIADRTCFDLQRHMEHSGRDMTVGIKLREPKREKRRVAELNMKVIGPKYKAKVKAITRYLEQNEIKDEDIDEAGNLHIVVDGEEYIITPDEYTLKVIDVNITERRIIPHVIEPSYGIDRIIYCILEHSFEKRVEHGEEYRVLHLPPFIAPIKVGVFPLVQKDGLDTIARDIYETLKNNGITCYYDEKGSIGRRYARMDEIGTPYCITVDYDTKEDNSVTLRTRDTKEQERINIETLVEHIKKYLDN